MTSKQNYLTLLVLIFLFSFPLGVMSQDKRLKPPRKSSKIKSVDKFVLTTFELYDKIFVYDSLTQVGVEIPSELEDELAKSAEDDLNELLDSAPDIAEDISDASFLKQAKATMNLNKAKKALKYCGLMVKAYFIGTEEEED